MSVFLVLRLFRRSVGCNSSARVVAASRKSWAATSSTSALGSGAVIGTLRVVGQPARSGPSAQCVNFTRLEFSAILVRGIRSGLCAYGPAFGLEELQPNNKYIRNGHAFAQLRPRGVASAHREKHSALLGSGQFRVERHPYTHSKVEDSSRGIHPSWHKGPRESQVPHCVPPS